MRERSEERKEGEGGRVEEGEVRVPPNTCNQLHHTNVTW